MALCAAALAVAVGAGVNSSAQARPSAAVQSLTVTDSQASVPTSNGQTPVATPAAGAIDAELDARINAIIDANSGYQLGIALVDLSDGG